MRNIWSLAGALLLFACTKSGDVPLVIQFEDTEAWTRQVVADLKLGNQETPIDRAWQRLERSVLAKPLNWELFWTLVGENSDFLQFFSEYEYKLYANLAINDCNPESQSLALDASLRQKTFPQIVALEANLRCTEAMTSESYEKHLLNLLAPRLTLDAETKSQWSAKDGLYLHLASYVKFVNKHAAHSAHIDNTKPRQLDTLARFAAIHLVSALALGYDSISKFDINAVNEENFSYLKFLPYKMGFPEKFVEIWRLAQKFYFHRGLDKFRVQIDSLEMAPLIFGIYFEKKFGFFNSFTYKFLQLSEPARAFHKEMWKFWIQGAMNSQCQSYLKDFPVDHKEPLKTNDCFVYLREVVRFFDTDREDFYPHIETGEDGANFYFSTLSLNSIDTILVASSRFDTHSIAQLLLQLDVTRALTIERITKSPILMSGKIENAFYLLSKVRVGEATLAIPQMRQFLVDGSQGENPQRDLPSYYSAVLADLKVWPSFLEFVVSGVQPEGDIDFDLLDRMLSRLPSNPQEPPIYGAKYGIKSRVATAYAMRGQTHGTRLARILIDGIMYGQEISEDELKDPLPSENLLYRNLFFRFRAEYEATQRKSNRESLLKYCQARSDMDPNAFRRTGVDINDRNQLSENPMKSHCYFLLPGNSGKRLWPRIPFFTVIERLQNKDIDAPSGRFHGSWIEEK